MSVAMYCTIVGTGNSNLNITKALEMQAQREPHPIEALPYTILWEQGTVTKISDIEKLLCEGNLEGERGTRSTIASTQ